MKGRANRRIERTEQPIEKPEYPLPGAFSPAKRSEFTTRRRPHTSSVANERAHFYRKGTSDAGNPVYGFYITVENRENEKPGSMMRQQDVS